jgi:hypothetical protein
MELSLSYVWNDLTDEQIEKISEGTFTIMHGIDSSIPEEYVRFKRKIWRTYKRNCGWPIVIQKSKRKQSNDFRLFK